MKFPVIFGLMVTADTIGPIKPTDAKGHRYVFSSRDRGTKYASAGLLKTKTDEETTRTFKLL